LTGGNKPYIYHWQTNGELKTKVPSTATTLYSLTINHLPGHEVGSLVRIVMVMVMMIMVVMMVMMMMMVIILSIFTIYVLVLLRS
jgi:hypothetical protein